MKNIVQEAEEYALSEIEKYSGRPPKFLFDIANKQADELIEKIKCDKEVVQLGVRLMDVKLGEAASKGKIKEHVAMCVEATKEFLSKFSISEEKKSKIINCVEAHHNKKWKCIEAEICANADCYKFLLVKNWLMFLSSLKSEEKDFMKNLDYVESKADEKWNILSLDICKRELEADYKLIKKIVEKARI